MWEIGRRLREQREWAKLTQGQVATYEGCDVNYISKLERGVNTPNVWPMLARLARRYGCSTDYLLGLTDDPSPRRTENDSADVRQVVALLRQLPEERQRDVLAIVQALFDLDERPGAAPSLDEALERMRSGETAHVVGDAP